MSTTRQVSLPTRFRRRLTVTFILVTAVTSGVLTLGSYLVAHEQRTDASQARAIQQARVLLDVAATTDNTDQLDSVLATTRPRDGFATLLVGNTAHSSLEDITIDDVPPKISQLEPGVIKTARTQIDGTHYIVAGGIVPNESNAVSLYVFISENQIFAGLEQLRNILIVGWLLVIVFAAACGSLVARRTLRPIQEASGAARALTEGLLDTRLSYTGKDEFGEWARYFNEMAGELQAKIAELEEANEREKRMTTDVAHDLRTPLGAMVAAASLLESELVNLDESARRPAELLINDVKRMRDLVADLLELARLDNNNPDISFEPVDLRALIWDVIDANRMRDVTELPEDTVIIVTDRIRVRRVLSNLLENAIKYGGGHASFDLRLEDDDAIIDVSDQGPGIPSDMQKRIFERFYKGASSRSDGGTGLGLAITAAQVEQLGGVIEVSNLEPHGARFRVILPGHDPQ